MHRPPRSTRPARALAAAALAALAAASGGCAREDAGGPDHAVVVADSAVPLPPPVVPHAGDTAAADAPRHVVYVPVYSRIYFGPSRRTVPLAVTLSVRNTDPERTVTIHEVRYYDTGGTLLRSYLSAPLVLAPMASTEFVVTSDDDTGGAGANFIVQWAAAQPVAEPVIESVMIGSSGAQGISFTSPGRTLVRH